MSAPQISVSLDLLFASGPAGVGERIERVAEAGADAVELWGWRAYDALSVRSALNASGVSLLTLCPDPAPRLTSPLDSSERRAFRESVEIAQSWGARFLVVTSGARRVGLPDAEQERQVTENLAELADVAGDAGLTVLLEPVESRVTAPNLLIDSVAAARRVIAEAQHPALQLLYDVFHIRSMEERACLDGIPIGHVQVADVPGRGAPGDGALDWDAEFDLLAHADYRGAIGLECRAPASLFTAVADLRRMLSRRSFGDPLPDSPSAPSPGATSPHHQKVKAP